MRHQLAKAKRLIDLATAEINKPGFKGLSQESIDCILSMQKTVRDMRDDWIRFAVAHKRMTQKEIAALFDLSPARVCQICAQ